jgi:hypothetical protein
VRLAGEQLLFTGSASAGKPEMGPVDAIRLPRGVAAEGGQSAAWL